MKVLVVAGAAAVLAACVPYHQERPALRMARPEPALSELSAYAAARTDYPTVGGDILKGTSPAESAAYQATTSAPASSPPVIKPVRP